MFYKNLRNCMFKKKIYFNLRESVCSMSNEQKHQMNKNSNCKDLMRSRYL